MTEKATFRDIITNLALGQLCSLLISMTAFAGGTIGRRPDWILWANSFPMVIVYSLLAVIYGSVLALRGISRSSASKQEASDISNESAVSTVDIPIEISASSSSETVNVIESSSETVSSRIWSFVSPWLPFFIIALLDFEGNFLLLMAYQYTSIVSVALLNAWVVPCVLLLGYASARWLPSIFSIWSEQYSFSWYRTIGSVVCCSGLVILFVADSQALWSAPVGDVMVFAGATFYAVSNLFQEYFVKTTDWVRVLFLYGVFGALISSLQLIAFELEELRHMTTTLDLQLDILPLYAVLVIFCVTMVGFYSIAPLVLRRTSAAFLNLSLLTTNFYTTLVSVAIFGQSFQPLYVISIIISCVGLVCFHWNQEWSSEIKKRIKLSQPLKEEEVEQVTETLMASQV